VDGCVVSSGVVQPSYTPAMNITWLHIWVKFLLEKPAAVGSCLYICYQVSVFVIKCQYLLSSVSICYQVSVFQQDWYLGPL
jgi:hypothetical protein